MKARTTLLGLVTSLACSLGVLTGVGSPAQAAVGPCDEGVIGYRINSPGNLEAGGHTVVIGLSVLTRTVTFTIADGSGCTLDVGDRWSVSARYFRASGTYDGTAASLAKKVQVSVPRSNSEAGGHPVPVTLDPVVGGDVLYTLDLSVKRRTSWQSF